MSNIIENDNYLQDMFSSGSIVPFHEKFLPLVTQPVVIEFPGLSLRTGMLIKILKGNILL